MKLFSYKNRPVHLGPYPLERLKRAERAGDSHAVLAAVPAMEQLSFRDEEHPESLINAMGDFEAMLDAIRDGLVKKEKAIIPEDLTERAHHLKSFSYYCDASQAAVCELGGEMFLPTPFRNPDIDKLAEDLRTKQTKTLASGIDVIMAELKESMEAPPTSVDHHTHAFVFLYEYPRDPEPHEPGAEWIVGTQPHRAALRAAETAAVISNYIRLLGYEARGHTASMSDVDLNKLAVAAGLAEIIEGADGPVLSNPYIGTGFGIGAVTTTLELAPDRALARRGFFDTLRSHGLAWWLGFGFAKNKFNQLAYRKRRFVDGAYPFEKIKRQEKPTTFMDPPRIPRVPKRTDMFARAQFGDMGKNVQEAARNGHYARKSALAFAPRRAIGAFVLMQDGDTAPEINPAAMDAARNSENVKAALYYLGADAVGLSECPSWAYYSHDAAGNELEPYHKNAVSVIIDQGHETMDGATGDDWVACSQSMRAYLRFSLLGSVIANHIRRLGYGAKSHTVMDGEVLQPPLLLLSGMGEVSRIGEVILNPYLGPRLKSGAITTDMPFVYDKPINFGLQNFCENCNKCARECPSGAITAGPKLMFNGYEIWKSDSQKCTMYRVTQAAGSMCGRCMKTCPWNLEGLFAEAPFRWMAMKMPFAAKWLAKLDDWLGNGGLNPVKKWWWDIEMVDEGPYAPAAQTNSRDLQKDLDLKYEDQTLAVYPAPLAPPPYFYPFAMDREAGIKAYKNMITPQKYKERLHKQDVNGLAHEFKMPEGPAPVIQVQITKAEKMTEDVAKYEFSSLDGSDLPPFEAGAHIDIGITPDYFRQYSLSGDPADRSTYQIAVLREDEGRGGSKMLHRIFHPGRKVFVSRPVNHFPLVEQAKKTLLLGGGIGITPMIAMAHELHEKGEDFVVHYSCHKRANAGFIDDLAGVAWADKVQLHFSDEGTRLDLEALLKDYRAGWHLYTCGPDRYMNAVLETAEAQGWPEDAVHKEYFSVPETPDYVNHPFKLTLAKSGRTLDIPADKSATDIMEQEGIPIDVKCSDGICGVCAAKVLGGEVEHRDFVLSKSQRAEKIILCQSRAAQENGEIVIDM